MPPEPPRDFCPPNDLASATACLEPATIHARHLHPTPVALLEYCFTTHPRLSAVDPFLVATTTPPSPNMDERRYGCVDTMTVVLLLHEKK